MPKNKKIYIFCNNKKNEKAKIKSCNYRERLTKGSSIGLDPK